MTQKQKKKKKKSPQARNKKLIILLAVAAVVLLVVLGVILVIVIKNKKEEPADPADTPTLESLDTSDLKLYEGYFEEDVVDVVVTCISGTANAYTVSGNTVTFTALAEDSVYSIAGKLKGNIVIDVGDAYKFDLEMHGLSLVCDTTNPIFISSGNEVTLTAKKDYVNYIYDMRAAVDESDETLFSGAIYATVDLEIAGKGSLTVVSAANNGIHSKDDLQVKNLTLLVNCVDNALKGNDSVTVEGGALTLIATQGDGIKTTNSNISEKGNQRGTVTILGGTHTIGAACDGIDAAYNVVIDDSTTVLQIYTDKYSSASEEVTATANGTYYLRYTNTSYKFSVKYYNSDEDVLWVNVSDSYETVSSSGKRPGSSGTTYYYYQFAKNTNYEKLAVYMYTATQEQGQESDYYACSSYKTRNDSYDTLSVTYNGGSLSLGWTNYTTASAGGGFGGGGGMMNEGNSDKGDYSTKGIKAANEIAINDGTITVKSYDDAIHANNDTALENGAAPLGNVTVNGGTVTLYSNDDGLHADGTLTITAGAVNVTNSYEGAEGAYINVLGGSLSINSFDDGMNATATSGTAITVGGGTIYIYCTGDGIDSNSRSAGGILFSGGNTVVISNSSGNSAIDSENGYAYTGGRVVAIMPARGMTNEATACTNFSSVGAAKSVSLQEGSHLTVKIDGAEVTVKMPCSISALVVVLGDSSPSVSTGSSTASALDANGVSWN